jgi:hypothetical protein
MGVLITSLASDADTDALQAAETRGAFLPHSDTAKLSADLIQVARYARSLGELGRERGQVGPVVLRFLDG